MTHERQPVKYKKKKEKRMIKRWTNLIQLNIPDQTRKQMTCGLILKEVK